MPPDVGQDKLRLVPSPWFTFQVMGRPVYSSTVVFQRRYLTKVLCNPTVFIFCYYDTLYAGISPSEVAAQCGGREVRKRHYHNAYCIACYKEVVELILSIHGLHYCGKLADTPASLDCHPEELLGLDQSM